MRHLIFLVLIGIGWALGWWIGGSHEWGWRIACLVTMGLGVVAVGSDVETSKEVLTLVMHDVARLYDKFR